MNIITDIWMCWIAAIVLFFAHCSDDDPRDKEAMLEEIRNHQNVVAINYYYDEHEWKNIITIDISLKNDVRIYIKSCKRSEDKDIVYSSVYDINGWDLWEIEYYTDSGEYSKGWAFGKEKEFLGNDSLMYLLDNYQKLYDFYMSVPRIDYVPYGHLRETFNSTSDKYKYDIYDGNGKVIGASKLYRRKKNCD